MANSNRHKPAKPKKCRECSQPFHPWQSTQVACSVECAAKLARKRNLARENKKTAKDTAERKKRLKTRSDWLKDAQKVVNEYVRLRDAGKPCISCDKPDYGTHQRHASHYRSTAAASQIRFYTLNIWASCAQCNTMKSGNLIEYRIRLNQKIPGLTDRLESTNYEARYSIEYLQRLIKVFKAKIRLYKKIRQKCCN